MNRPEILDHASTLAELTRCRILQLLDGHELAVSELCSVLQAPQSTVSRHLKVLVDGGWLRSRREGTSHLYELAADGLGNPAAALWALLRQQIAGAAVVQQDQQRLEGVLRERRTRSEEFFSSTAEEWDRVRDELFGGRFDLLALAALFDPTWTVGDLGCGTGRISQALAPWVEQVVAVDGSGAMLAAARRRLADFPNVAVRQGELERLPIEDASLDAATLFLALHHLGQPEQALNEARRVLRPGGRLLVVDMLPHDREEYRRQMGHVWLGFGDEAISRWLDRAGFVEVRFNPLPADPEAKGPTLFAAVAGASSSPRVVSRPVPEAVITEPDPPTVEIPTVAPPTPERLSDVDTAEVETPLSPEPVLARDSESPRRTQ